MNGRTREVSRTRATIGGALAVLAAGALWIDSGVTSSAIGPVPQFPDNIVVFPDRDFVSVEGYSGYGGQVATLVVERAGVGIVGSAEATVSGTDVAFEINHPGGECWGAGTGLMVTPDIRPGDTVTMIIGGVEVGTTTVLDAQASDAILQADGVTVIVNGHIGVGVDPANLEQRIIEPELRNTSVAKRDVRALPGPMTPGPSGYSSSLEITGNTFVATYVFDEPLAAELTANAALGERAMTWQVTDPAGNRQGLTIAEFGEPGGPGMGGCPNGPLQSGPPGPTNVVASRNPGSPTINVAWTPAVAIPGTPAILGYEVTAIDTNASGAEFATFGRRITNPAANQTTITGLDPSREYVVEVVSTSSVGVTFPPIPATTAPDTTPPTITASVPAGSYPLPQTVGLSADEPGVDIYYTLDGTDPINAVGTTPTAIPYTGPITVPGPTTTLKFAGYDAANNASVITTVTYVITNDPVAAPTAVLSVTPALESADVSWAPADPVSPATSITGYIVRVYDAANGTTPVTTVNAAGNVLSTTVNGLTANTPYWFSVAAKNDVNSNWGPESSRFGPVSPFGDVVANAGPDQTNVPRGTVVQLTGAGSTTTGVTYQWTQMTSAAGTTVMPAGPNSVTLTGANTLNPQFLLPTYTPLMSLDPLHFRLTVSDGVSAPISDMVTIAPRNDTVSVTTAKWKPGDFRVVGTGAINGATITVWATVNGVTSPVGNAQVVAGAWTVRLRNNAPTQLPSAIWAVSNQGANVGPITVTAG